MVALAALAVMLLFPASADALLVQALCCVLVFGALLGSMAVKQGLSPRGIEGFFYTIPWERVKEARMESTGFKKLAVTAVTDRGECKLRFSVFQQRDITACLQNHNITVYLHKSLEQTH